MLEAAQDAPLTVDLEAQTVTDDSGASYAFRMDPFRRQCLLNGLDEIALTGELADELDAYEARLTVQRPWIAGNA
jgi:3-isopropylmalate/(R)-2-methylmalate dehydratase small subunit